MTVDSFWTNRMDADEGPVRPMRASGPAGPHRPPSCSHA
ncbi:hypothetical protein GLA29479_3164 [Lysobacter antibioticus]|nr:hypothetical protein GLA29479_3164 [Lysobacter antibioticus]